MESETPKSSSEIADSPKLELEVKTPWSNDLSQMINNQSKTETLVTSIQEQLSRVVQQNNELKYNLHYFNEHHQKKLDNLQGQFTEIRRLKDEMENFTTKTQIANKMFEVKNKAQMNNLAKQIEEIEKMENQVKQLEIEVNEIKRTKLDAEIHHRFEMETTKLYIHKQDYELEERIWKSRLGDVEEEQKELAKDFLAQKSMHNTTMARFKKTVEQMAVKMIEVDNVNEKTRATQKLFKQEINKMDAQLKCF